MKVVLQQVTASNPAHSVWMGANAGTGKTKVLTDRVLRLLLQGTLPDRILCLTYTKAAAAEMANRINNKLQEWAVIPDKDLREGLTALNDRPVKDTDIKRARELFTKVIDAPEGVRILTIHSLCQSLLRRFSIEAGVSPYFRVMEEQESLLLINEAKHNLLGLNAPEESDTNTLKFAIKNMASTMAESTFDSLLKQIVSQRPDFQQLLSYEGGLSAISSALQTLLNLSDDEVDENSLLRRYFTRSDAERTELIALAEALQQSDKKTDIDLHAALTKWLHQHTAPKHADVEPYIGACLTQTLSFRKNLPTQSVSKPFPEAIGIVENEQKKCEQYAQKKLSLDTLKRTEELLIITQALLALYSSLKTSKGLMDYEDLISRTSHLLQMPGISPWVLYKLDGGIDHLLVDEAQDTSRVQWQLVEALVSDFFNGDSTREYPRTLFVVGDEKQSIYSFQGAEPRAFGEMKQYFARRIKTASQPYENVNLSLSFRSTPAVLKLVDTVFKFSDYKDGVTFEAEETIDHQAHREVPGKVELWPVIQPDETSERAPWTIPTEPQSSRRPERILAEKIADTIKKWLDEKRYLPAKGRAVQASDIMILVRRRNRFFEELISALKNRNIPLAGADRMQLAEHIAVQDMLAFARFLLLPEDDLNLASLLKSPLFGMNEEELFILCYERAKGAQLWKSLRNRPEALYKKAAEELAYWLGRVDYLPPYEIFSELLDAKGGRKNFKARMGDEVEDPLNEFLSLSLHFEQLNTPSLQGFLKWFEESGTVIKRDLEQSKQEIRILTVHGSKGLQAPIIFLPDTTAIPINKDSIFWQHGLPVWSYDSKKDSLAVKKAKAEHKAAALQEYRRLLYVALTRAEDELYIAGWQGDKNPPELCWHKMVTQAMEEIGTETENGVWCYEDDPNLFKTTEAKQSTEATIIDSSPLPAFFNAPAPVEPNPTRPLMPSKPEAEEPPAESPLGAPQSNASQRGQAIHKLLEILPNIQEENRKEVASLLLRKHFAAASDQERAECTQQVIEILEHPNYAPLFGKNAQAEVPITAIIEAKGTPRVLSGRIDRLVILQDSVLILDFKTSRFIPQTQQQIPDAFKEQLRHYAKAVQILYPNKRIETAILWTQGPKIMPVNTALALAA